MRKTVLLGMLATTLWLLGGCQGVTKTPEEVKATHKQIMDMDSRQMADDWNLLWLADRPYRLTRWHMR